MQEIIKRYLEAWNETDAAARLALVASVHGFLDKVPAAA